MQNDHPGPSPASAALTDHFELTVSELAVQRTDASKVHIDP